MKPRENPDIAVETALDYMFAYLLQNGHTAQFKRAREKIAELELHYGGKLVRPLVNKIARAYFPTWPLMDILPDKRTYEQREIQRLFLDYDMMGCLVRIVYHTETENWLTLEGVITDLIGDSLCFGEQYVYLTLVHKLRLIDLGGR